MIERHGLIWVYVAGCVCRVYYMCVCTCNCECVSARCSVCACVCTCVVLNWRLCQLNVIFRGDVSRGCVRGGCVDGGCVCVCVSGGCVDEAVRRKLYVYCVCRLCLKETHYELTVG